MLLEELGTKFNSVLKGRFVMIVIAGKNDIAVWGLRQLIALVGKDNLAVVPNQTDDGINRWQKSLRYFSNAWDVKEITIGEAQDCADIFLSLEFDRLIRPSKFSTEQLFNIHFSLLPKYKGMFTSTWPILNNEPSSGVTLHVIDDGIDTGPIVDQQAFSINPETTSRDLYVSYTATAISVVQRNLSDILNGKCTSVQQPFTGATYYSKKSLDYSKSEIDIRQTAEEVLCFVRAFCFREYQLPCFAGRKVVRAQIVGNKSLESCEGGSDSSDRFQIVNTIDYPVKLFFDHLNDFLDACKNDDLNLINRYIKNIVSVDDKEVHGWTPLMVAAYNNSIKAAKFLIGCGADINAINNNGTTVLMYAKDGALRSRDVTIFNMLVALGANPHQRDYRGKSIFDYVNAEELKWLGIYN
jgi:methionyl-tRNA formyltransferase